MGFCLPAFFSKAIFWARLQEFYLTGVASHTCTFEYFYPHAYGANSTRVRRNNAPMKYKCRKQKDN